MSTTNLLIILAVIGVGAAVAFIPSVRQLFRIRGGKVVDAGTSALEKEEDSYKQLVARLPKNRDAVARTKANAVIQERKLTDLQTKLEGLKKEYKLANDQNAPEATKTAIETDFANTKAAIENQATVAAEAKKVATEALTASSRPPPPSPSSRTRSKPTATRCSSRKPSSSPPPPATS